MNTVEAGLLRVGRTRRHIRMLAFVEAPKCTPRALEIHIREGIMAEPMLIAKSKEAQYLLPQMANRHGLVAGATGTGKTVTLQVMAEAFSRAGVAVFAADVKGDLSGTSQSGKESAKIAERVKKLGLEDFAYQASPATFWDVLGEQGHPVRTTVSEMGPLLFSRLLNLNDTQTGVLSLVFKIADDHQLLLLDLKDLQAVLQFVGEQAKALQTEYGNISAASVGAIQRGLVTLGQEGGDKFFGEPALNIDDLMQTDANGRGVVNILASDKLIQSPRVYATLLLWLLKEIYEKLPEVGDPEKPKLVFFFDEAHLLFNDLPSVVRDKVTQVVRLVRSKGVGVYFVSQNPLDIPEAVLGQLGNRVQHALRAFTPRDQKNVKAAAETFRANPKVDVGRAITELGVGEGLVSVLDDKGTPTPVERAWILPPQSRLTPLTPAERDQVVKGSVLYGHYEKTVDRESAYEILKSRAELAKEGEAARGAQKRQPPSPEEQAGKILLDMGKSAARSAGTQIGRQIMRGILGSLFGRK